ncbi:hypothetical protein [Actinoplanes sp. RD1]|uniref:hypothetical protein n=1 Tax=Actinoplanes sp. RD1 TaxID=3064538 RepID=UPI002741E2C5|nr:hypothetical protein [Actinoplanes sp. RD1]
MEALAYLQGKIAELERSNRLPNVDAFQLAYSELQSATSALIHFGHIGRQEADQLLRQVISDYSRGGGHQVALRFAATGTASTRITPLPEALLPAPPDAGPVAPDLDGSENCGLLERVVALHPQTANLQGITVSLISAELWSNRFVVHLYRPASHGSTVERVISRSRWRARTKDGKNLQEIAYHSFEDGQNLVETVSFTPGINFGVDRIIVVLEPDLDSDVGFEIRMPVEG